MFRPYSGQRGELLRRHGLTVNPPSQNVLTIRAQQLFSQRTVECVGRPAIAGEVSVVCSLLLHQR